MKQSTEFGRWAKKRLIDLEMTQAELARQVGTSRQYINQIFSGKKKNSKYEESIRAVLEKSKQEF